MVLFRDQEGELICLRDRCPHRLAKLSDGQVIDGRLECLYHGWQFDKNGNCLHIPHLLAGANIPERAKVQAFPVSEQQGMVWVWADDKTLPDPEWPLEIPEVEQAGVFKVDTATDFPFDHTFLVENLLDPAHVYISHDRTELGIRREDAQPLSMEILSTSVAGIEARFRRVNQLQAPWTTIKFHAPMLVHYCFSNPTYGVIGGLALYALPLAYGQSRILVRRYGNFYKKRFTLKPRWLEHLRQNKILEQDLSFITEQDRFFRETKQTIKTGYFPIKTCDTLVIEHRRWLDQYGQNLPWYVGLESAKHPQEINTCSRSNDLSTRFERHTQHCQSCQRMVQRLKHMKRIGGIGAIIAISLALLNDEWPQLVCILGLILSVAAIFLATRLQSHFHDPDVLHDQ